MSNGIISYASEDYVMGLVAVVDEKVADLEEMTEGLSGTVEITDGDPEKAHTILTIKPNANEINLYTAEEIDSIANTLSDEVDDVDNKVSILSKEKADKSEIPTTLPASDVYEWAKQSTKPTYTAEEVGAATQEDFENALNNLSGTVEVTDEDPSKTGTVLTINPGGEEINIYSAEEVDAMIEELRQAILSLQSE